VHRFGLFGGTNGHWRRQVLQEITFKEDLLTEDIDSSIRSTIAGYKVWYDNRIISTELAPLTIAAYLKQRKRWAQGWLQVGELGGRGGILEWVGSQDGVAGRNVGPPPGAAGVTRQECYTYLHTFDSHACRSHSCAYGP
jgi:hypothetical protein